MSNIFNRLLQKREQGQILVIMGLIFIGLVAVIGLAIDLGLVFVAHSRLNRAVDAAALAATSEFKRNYRINDMRAAAEQMLKLNDIDETNTLDIDIDTCTTRPGDTELCTNPPRKLVRVIVQQNVPLYFLSVVGVRFAPLEVRSLSEAASLDVMVVVDRSQSMTENAPDGSTYQDPKICNESDPIGLSNSSPSFDGTFTQGPDGLPGECHPFEEVKWASVSFVNRLNFEFDRLGIVVFDRLPHIGETIHGVGYPGLPLTGGIPDNPSTPNNESEIAAATVIDAVKAMEVYEGSGLCPWTTDDKMNKIDPFSGEEIGPGDARYNEPGLIEKWPNDENREPCRLYRGDWTYFETMDCPNINHPPRDPSRCLTSNLGGGLALAGNALAGNYGVYAPYLPYTPVVRRESVWVIIMVTDGLANAGYNPDPLCPSYTWTRWPQCRDKDPYTRHDESETYLYDGDDYARDMADIVASNSVFIFSIGLGEKVNQRDDRSWAPANCVPFSIDPDASSKNCSAGQELLGYFAIGAAKAVNEPTFAGTFYNVGSDANKLEQVFLDIYNKLTTKLAK